MLFQTAAWRFADFENSLSAPAVSKIPMGQSVIVVVSDCFGKFGLQSRGLRAMRHSSQEVVDRAHEITVRSLASGVSELGGQPLPTASRKSAEERYELLRKLQAILHTLGFAGVIVLIDRVDEPQQVEGDPRKMRSLIWPLLDHKFLRHPGIGVKLLLPIELAYYLEKEDKEFYDRCAARQAQPDQAPALDRGFAV